MTPTVSDIQPIKDRMKATWMAGDFGQIAKYNAGGAEEFVERLALRPGLQVLDVACGTGNQSIPAALTGANVTGVDIAPNLLEQARERARAEGLQIMFQEGDAEQLAFPDNSFDVVMSMFGAMFAPRPEMVARELVRVCRPGGRIAMGNWTPEGLPGQMFKTVAKHVPPPPVPPPVQWGVEEVVRQRFSEGTSDIQFTRQFCPFQFPFGPADVVKFFRTYFGPTQRAFAALDAAGQEALRSDLEAIWSDHNRATDGTTEARGEYLEVVATKA
jgi:SAM-dependent methyltransferase